MSDAQRIVRAKAGDSDAFDSLYEWSLPRVFRYALAATGDQAAAEEIASEAFVVIVRQWDRLPDHDFALLAMLRQVVHRKAVDWIRHQVVCRRAFPVLSTPRDVSEDASAPLLAGEQQALVFEAMSQLSETYRTVLELRYFDDQSLAEIAMVLNVKPGAANSLLYRARIAFREAILGLDPSSDEDLSSHFSGRQKQAAERRGAGGAR